MFEEIKMEKDLDAILSKAKECMEGLINHVEKGRTSRVLEYAGTDYAIAICYGIDALYLQNRVIIELLREKKEKTHP